MIELIGFGSYSSKPIMRGVSSGILHVVGFGGLFTFVLEGERCIGHDMGLLRFLSIVAIDFARRYEHSGEQTYASQDLNIGPLPVMLNLRPQVGQSTMSVSEYDGFILLSSLLLNG